MKQKKILYVITKSVWGGAQRYVFDLVTNLPKDKFEVVVAAGGSGLLFDRLREAGVRTIIIPGLQRDVNFLKEFVSFWHLLKISLREKPDVVHLNSTKIGGLGAVAARIVSLVVGRRSSVIFTVHGWGFNEDRAFPVRAVIFFISWFSSFFQDKVICINTADLKTAQKFIPRRKLALIFNGIGPIDFLPRAEARAFFAKKIGREILEDTILIGTNAELTKNKGLPYLIDALHNLRPTRLPSASPQANGGQATHKLQAILISSGEDREKLQNQINFLGLQNTVFLAGFIPDAARHLKAFDIFILPSLKEGLPYTIIEAMAVGLPVVATNVGGIPDLIESGKTGLLVTPKDAKGLAEALQTLLRNKGLRENLGNHASKVAETKFKLRDMIENTIECYDGN